MKQAFAADTLWGASARYRWLLLTTIVLLFTCLGAKEIWTQEHRWADIVAGMFYRHDFFHPYLGTVRYYDKPLLSYWMVAGFAWLFNSLNTWALRLPSALAGLLAVWSIYRIGCIQRGKSFGLLCGWMLVTTFYFVFWARVSSADMLNVGGTLFAICWYLARRHQATFFDYSVFFIILSLTCLCKGLGGAVLPVIAVFVDMCLQRSFKQHLTLKLLFSLIPGLMVYLIPFWLSNHFGGDAYGQSGLYLVYKENVLRYFQPFDHQGPIYTYFIYLPVYLMPWTLFFIPALFSLPSRYKAMTQEARFNLWTFVLIFLFFTLSGSRRSYYVLPIVPFAVLVTADWINVSGAVWRQRLAGWCAIISVILIFVAMDILPAIYYSNCGIERFALALKHEVEKKKTWDPNQVVMLDAESKLSFYLQLPPTTQYLGVQGKREAQTAATLQQKWPMLKNPLPNVIVISRKLYAPILDQAFPEYTKVSVPHKQCLPFISGEEANEAVAYIP